MPEIPPLPETKILLVEVGSTAHGTGLPGGEDHDEMGVVIEPPEAVLGLDPRGFTTGHAAHPTEGTRSGPGDTDRTLHSLRRFLRPAAGGNPSILMSLWAPVLYATDEGHQLRNLADAFIGRHVVPRYRGYMESQATRLLGTRGDRHGRRGGGQREELIAEHGYDTKYAMHCVRLGFQCIELLTTRQLQLPIQGEPADWLRAVRRGDVPFGEWQARWGALDAALDKWVPTRRTRPDLIGRASSGGVSKHTSSAGGLASLRHSRLTQPVGCPAISSTLPMTHGRRSGTPGGVSRCGRRVQVGRRARPSRRRRCEVPPGAGRKASVR